MATIKTTIKLETTTLFPTPVNLTVPVIEQVNLDANFTSVSILPNSEAIPYTSTALNPSNVVYVYLQSPATNTVNLNVFITDHVDREMLAMIICPGDFAWFPLASYGGGVQLRIVNNDISDSASLNVFYGERG
jgi:hypothetical protein